MRGTHQYAGNLVQAMPVRFSNLRSIVDHALRAESHEMRPWYPYLPQPSSPHHARAGLMRHVMFQPYCPLFGHKRSVERKERMFFNPVFHRITVPPWKDVHQMSKMARNIEPNVSNTFSEQLL
jgi:hypothetical protein